MDKRFIIFLGAPGAGKGTQAATVAEKLKLAHIATGDLFRQAQTQGTQLALEAKSYMDKGALVPDELTIQMVLERISAQDCQAGVIFDGFPRNVKQAEALDKALAELGEAITEVIQIKVSDEELLVRLTGRRVCRQCQTPYHLVSSPPKVQGKCDRCGGELYQRSDDNEETIKNRIGVYYNETAPLIDFYNKVGKLLEIDGGQNPEEVGRSIIESLDKAFGKP